MDAYPLGPDTTDVFEVDAPRKRAVLFAVGDNGLGDACRQAGDAGQKRGRGVIEVHADLRHAVLGHVGKGRR